MKAPRKAVFIASDPALILCIHALQKADSATVLDAVLQHARGDYRSASPRLLGGGCCTRTATCRLNDPTLAADLIEQCIDWDKRMWIVMLACHLCQRLILLF